MKNAADGRAGNREMTRQTHGLAAKTGLIEALRPAGYEFETGETDSRVATGFRRPLRVMNDVRDSKARARRRIPHERVSGALNGHQGKDAAGQGQGKGRQGSGRA
jgi:hypothetical protein